MKYIDADRLRSEIKERLHCNGSFDECGDTAWDYDQGMVAAYNYVLSFIDSLQQEQLPGIEEHGVPGRDFIPVEWVDACEKYGKWKIVQQEQPSLPDNLDEVANSYASKTECAVVACRGFKAGAGWMAKQGFISEGIIYQTSGKDTMIDLNEHIGYLEDCDEVIVQIRKK